MKRSLLLGVLLVTLRCTDEPAKPPLAIVSISPSAGTKNTIVDITGTVLVHRRLKTQLPLTEKQHLLQVQLTRN